MGGDEAVGLRRNLLKQKRARRRRSQRSSPSPLHRFCPVQAIAARLRDDRDSAHALHSYAGAHAHDCSGPRELRRHSAVPTL
jgi:hypothetical protein